MTSLPSLGPRGEGWVAIQGILLAGAAVAGLSSPGWTGGSRLATSIVGAMLIIGGLALATMGAHDLRDALTPLPYPRAGARLVETGVYRLVRHPIYGGLVLAAAGWGLLTASVAALVAAVVLFGFFELKSRREEAWLERRFDGYRAYRARTRRLIPWVG